jgi:hypothetical protein
MKRAIAATALAGLSLGVHAADTIRIGFMSTLSGPSAALGIDIRDAFDLVVKRNGGKLGGVPVETIVVDDQQNADTGKQLAARLIKKDRVDVVTGIVFTNVMLAVAPAILENRTFLVSANAGPTALSGEGCNPYFYAVSWQNDAVHEAAGKFAQDKGYKSAVLLAPNYPAGKDALVGFKRFYKGVVIDEIYTKLGQLDFAAELAQVRAAKPAAVYIFQPGGMGVNFIKQFNAAGLAKADGARGPRLLGRRGHHQGRRRSDGRHVQHVAMGLRPRQRAEPAVRRRVPEGLRPSADDVRVAGLRHGAAARRRDPRREGQGRRQAGVRQGARRRELQVGAGRLQVQREPLPDPALLPAPDLEGRERPHHQQARRHGAAEPRRCVRVGVQDGGVVKPDETEVVVTGEGVVCGRAVLGGPVVIPRRAAHARVPTHAADSVIPAHAAHPVIPAHAGIQSGGGPRDSVAGPQRSLG